MKKVLKTISIKDAIGWFAQAWQNVSAETIRSSWNTLSTNICEPCQSQPSSDTFEISSVDLSDGNPIETLNLKSNVLSNTILPVEAVQLLGSIIPMLENDQLSTSEEVQIFNKVVLRGSYSTLT